MTFDHNQADNSFGLGFGRRKAISKSGSKQDILVLGYGKNKESKEKSRHFHCEFGDNIKTLLV